MSAVYATGVQIRWSDQDLFGHVNNARVVTLLEDARIRFLTQVAPADGYPEFPTPKLVASQTINYRRPVHYGSDLLVDISVVRIGTKSYTLSYVARQNGHTVVDASTIMVPLSEEGGLPRGLTNPERIYLARFQDEAIPVGA